MWSPRRPVSRGSQGRAPIGRGECEMPQLSFEDGFDLHFEQYGPPAGTAPAVVFAHGAGGNAFSWWHQVPAFADRYTVVTFDHRAFGRSTDVAAGPGRIAFGTDLRSLLDHLGLERIHLVAHSMGGRTAFGIVSRQPERIASLTYSGTNGGCVDDRYRGTAHPTGARRHPGRFAPAAGAGQGVRRARAAHAVPLRADPQHQPAP